MPDAQDFDMVYYRAVIDIRTNCRNQSEWLDAIEQD